MSPMIFPQHHSLWILAVPLVCKGEKFFLVIVVDTCSNFKFLPQKAIHLESRTFFQKLSILWREKWCSHTSGKLTHDEFIEVRHIKTLYVQHKISNTWTFYIQQIITVCLFIKLTQEDAACKEVFCGLYTESSGQCCFCTNQKFKGWHSITSCLSKQHDLASKWEK